MISGSFADFRIVYWFQDRLLILGSFTEFRIVYWFQDCLLISGSFTDFRIVYWFQDRLLTAPLTNFINGGNSMGNGVTYGLPSTCPEVVIIVLRHFKHNTTFKIIKPYFVNVDFYLTLIYLYPKKGRYNTFLWIFFG